MKVWPAAVNSAKVVGGERRILRVQIADYTLVGTGEEVEIIRLAGVRYPIRLAEHSGVRIVGQRVKIRSVCVADDVGVAVTLIHHYDHVCRLGHRDWLAAGPLVTGVLVTGVLVTGVLVTGVLVTGVLVTGVLVTGVLVTGVLVTGAERVPVSETLTTGETVTTAETVATEATMAGVCCDTTDTELAGCAARWGWH